jgi:predicted unusual protein kinase regulating ubiquinone biosynthesis (AarF/ABC1/UbiB family)
LLVPRPIRKFTSSRVLTMEFIDGRKITDLDADTREELPGERLAEELFRAYMHQVLVDGVFHADPHPGNLLLTPSRCIAVLDLGSVFHVSPQMQEWLFQLLLAVSDGRGEDATDVAIKMGMPKAEFAKSDFSRAVSHLVAETRDEGIQRLQTGRVVLNIQQVAAHHGFRLPDELTMLGKTLMHLDQVLGALAPEFQLNASIRRYARTIMRRRSRKFLSLPAVLQSTLEIGEFAQKLPIRLNKIMDLLAENEMRLHVDAVDEKRLLQGIQKIANRITSGLVLAALIIGASITMHIESSATVWGYPILSAIFFVMAALGGFVLVYQSLFHDE